MSHDIIQLEQTTGLFVELSLSLLAVLLGALFSRHVLSNRRARMGLVSCCLGIDALVLLDGLDVELLFVLCGKVVLAGCDGARFSGKGWLENVRPFAAYPWKNPY